MCSFSNFDQLLICSKQKCLNWSEILARDWRTLLENSSWTSIWKLHRQKAIRVNLNLKSRHTSFWIIYLEDFCSSAFYDLFVQIDILLWYRVMWFGDIRLDIIYSLLALIAISSIPAVVIISEFRLNKSSLNKSGLPTKHLYRFLWTCCFLRLIKAYREHLW